MRHLPAVFSFLRERVLTTRAAAASCSVLAIALVAALPLAATLPADAQTESVIYSFSGAPDAAYPEAGLLRVGGAFYGTTHNGGVLDAGAVFAVTSNGQERVLHSFAGFPTDGTYPFSGLVRDAQGNLYGTTANGGSTNYGTVFKIARSGVETVLHVFAGGTDGAYPFGGLVLDGNGNLYGTTSQGGARHNGIVFEISSTGAETVLHTFKGPDGSFPLAGLLRDAQGNLYGTTLYGGANGQGTVFSLSPTGRERVLFSFTGGADGSNPYAGVIRDQQGNLYGTTFNGGTSGLGTVYELSSSGMQVLHGFAGGTDGANSCTGLVRDTQGNLFGTTFNGGISGFGTVFEVTSTGSETVLYPFTGLADGGNPQSTLLRDAQGNLYGTTVNGGAAGYGAVFKVAP